MYRIFKEVQVPVGHKDNDPIPHLHMAMPEAYRETDYGEGVWEVVSVNYGEAIAEFCSKHPKLQITAMTFVGLRNSDEHMFVLVTKQVGSGF